MPEICRFYGIVIKMFFDGHNPPHFHAEYADYEALIDVNTLAVLSGRGCVKTRNFLDSGGASPLPYTEIVVYRRSSEDKFLDQNFIRSFHTAWADCRHVLKLLSANAQLSIMKNFSLIGKKPRA